MLPILLSRLMAAENSPSYGHNADLRTESAVGLRGFLALNAAQNSLFVYRPVKTC
jgi:hypothetical protein